MTENRRELIGDEIRLALKNIRRFIRINGLSVKPKVVVSYNIENPGCFYFHWDDRTIYINPKECRMSAMARRYQANGYVNTYKMEDVIYHEFGHLLDSKYDINKDYINTTLFKLNSNCTSKTEEWAECFNLYMTNPYLLKILSDNTDPAIYEFFRERYKPSVSCSKNLFKKIYNNWNDALKSHCKKRLGISVESGKIVINKKIIKKYFGI